MADPAIDVTVFSPDRLERSVWVVVDPRDVVTGARALVPLRVRLKDVEAEPLAGRSGVYCFTDLNLPAGGHTVQVQALHGDRTRYFDAEQAFVLEPIPVPGQPLKRNPVSVALLPRPAYPFAEQVTLARGRLVRSSDGSGVDGAQIFLIVESVDQGLRGRTDERGEFVACFPPTTPEDNAAAGLKDLKFRLRFELAGEPPVLIAEEIVREGATISLEAIQFPGI
jgi:hypothetical protein